MHHSLRLTVHVHGYTARSILHSIEPKDQRIISMSFGIWNLRTHPGLHTMASFPGGGRPGNEAILSVCQLHISRPLKAPVVFTVKYRIKDTRDSLVLVSQARLMRKWVWIARLAQYAFVVCSTKLTRILYCKWQMYARPDNKVRAVAFRT